MGLPATALVFSALWLGSVGYAAWRVITWPGDAGKFAVIVPVGMFGLFLVFAGVQFFRGADDAKGVIAAALRDDTRTPG